MDNGKRYPSDLTDGQWEKIGPLLPAAKLGGRPRKVEMREIMNGIFYVVRGGGSWRMLPKDLPPGEHKLCLRIGADRDERSTGHALRVLYFVAN